jgi:chondroitin AC lyase
MIRTLSLIFCIIISMQVYGQKDLQRIKTRIVKELHKSDIDDSRVEQSLATMSEDGSWPEINYTDLSLTGYEHRIHIENLEAMALSYSIKESRFYKDKELQTGINKALRFWCDKDFISDNWWHNIILTPRTFVTISLIMEKDIDPDLLEQMQPIIRRASKNNRWARPSGDRVKICGIEAKNYLLTGEEDNFKSIIKIIEGEVKLTTGNRGIQCDYSFHHRVHRVNNTSTYGLTYADACSEWAAYVADTRFSFPEEKVKLLVNYYLDGICKQMVYGKYSDKGVCNRDITRKETSLIYSPVSMERLLEVTDYRKSEIQEIIDLRQGKIEKPTLSFCKFFWQTEHLAFQRPDFYTSVRMFSIRNRNMELAHSSEGIFNHHRADGTNHLAVRGDEYLNIWPVYDWQKIPGTTILQKPKMPSQHEILKDGLTEFVGAVSDGLYGVAGFDFISPHDNIRAKKSWFFFDDEYVCLGAGIASNDFNNPVATTINQALLSGDVIVSKANDEMKIETGEHEIDEVKWVIHDGTGYLFPAPVKINILNKTQSGRWSDINKQAVSPKELVEKDVFKIWINHGIRPQGENLWLYPGKMDTRDVTYQYIVVPVTTPEQLNEKREIVILSNTSKIQSVKHTGLGITQIVFYESGKVEVDKGQWLTIDSPGIVMLKMKGGKIEKISASDPTRTLSKLHIGLTGMSDIVIDLPQGDYSGDSETKVFQ